MSLADMRRELREKYEKLKSDDDRRVYAPWRDRRCAITEEHKQVLKRWFELQNELLEPLPKKLQGTYHPAIEVGLAMENAMDVARELSRYPYAHMPYIDEKIKFLRNRLENLVEAECL